MESLAVMEHRLLTDPALDKQDAHEVLRLGRMFLYMCDLESDAEPAESEVCKYDIDGETVLASTVLM